MAPPPKRWRTTAFQSLRRAQDSPSERRRLLDCRDSSQLLGTTRLHPQSGGGPPHSKASGGRKTIHQSDAGSRTAGILPSPRGQCGSTPKAVEEPPHSKASGWRKTIHQSAAGSWTAGILPSSWGQCGSTPRAVEDHRIPKPPAGESLSIRAPQALGLPGFFPALGDDATPPPERWRTTAFQSLRRA